MKSESQSGKKPWYKKAALSLAAFGSLAAGGIAYQVSQPKPKEEPEKPSAKQADTPLENDRPRILPAKKDAAFNKHTDANNDGKISRDEWLAALKRASIHHLEEREKNIKESADERLAEIQKSGEAPTPEESANIAIMKNDEKALKAALGKMGADQKKEYLEGQFFETSNEFYVPLQIASAFYLEHTAIMQERNNVNGIMRVLLEEGAPPNPRIRSNDTPLTALLQDVGKLKLLKEFGANLLEGDIAGRHSLHTGSLSSMGCYNAREPEIVPGFHYMNPRLMNDKVMGSQSIDKMRYLLESELPSADMFAPKSMDNRYGSSVFRGAYDEERTRLLLKYGAPVKFVGYNGNTPLHHCFDLGSVKALVEAGADVFAKNEKEQTPLDIVKERYAKDTSEPMPALMGPETERHKAARQEEYDANIQKMAKIIDYLEMEMAKAKPGAHLQKQQERDAVSQPMQRQ